MLGGYVINIDNSAENEFAKGIARRAGMEHVVIVGNMFGFDACKT